jgi:hypothetical protein
MTGTPPPQRVGWTSSSSSREVVFADRLVRRRVLCSGTLFLTLNGAACALLPFLNHTVLGKYCTHEPCSRRTLESVACRERTKTSWTSIWICARRWKSTTSTEPIRCSMWHHLIRIGTHFDLGILLTFGSFLSASSLQNGRDVLGFGVVMLASPRCATR